MSNTSNTAYSPDFLASVERTISHARLTRYMAATGNDLALALDLYEKNVAVSEALFGLLHGLEVAVRNSLHHTLSTDLGIADWYRDGLPLPWAPYRLSLTLPMKRSLSDARQNIKVGRACRQADRGTYFRILAAPGRKAF